MLRYFFIIMKMNNTGMIVRSKVKENYTIIKNDILTNKKISLKAKGLLCLLLSLPNDWVIYKTQLSDFSSDGRDATTNSFNELVELGYILSVQRVNEKGQKMGYDYIVYDEISVPDTEKPITGFPKLDNPNTDKPALQSTNIQNTNKQSKNKKNTNILDTSTSIENYDDIIFGNKSVEGLDEELNKWLKK